MQNKKNIFQVVKNYFDQTRFFKFSSSTLLYKSSQPCYSEFSQFSSYILVFGGEESIHMSTNKVKKKKLFLYGKNNDTTTINFVELIIYITQTHVLSYLRQSFGFWQKLHSLFIIHAEETFFFFFFIRAIHQDFVIYVYNYTYI